MLEMRRWLSVAIEPMITMGDRRIGLLPDRWGIVTRDGKPAAHFEHTIVVRRGKAEILSTFDLIENPQ
jgi:methionyl aminopeptidase